LKRKGDFVGEAKRLEKRRTENNKKESRPRKGISANKKQERFHNDE
jgi:hypothetical protein